ncbi:DUF1257 domain-containing protein [Gloeobacter violaceus]|uniref:Glr3093 protein n=1 Tax=Gloeobacter violaceus (strain ATCC 29082 / PCC 7421) TaxID=251221 RepID=Q7NC86_GLOVI|nr:DUF1257 domain-containing protein [Gloeobacter violaceus]BAC91034.1 glr3093 [Gloeobacter violaceus PCC 7421]
MSHLSTLPTKLNNVQLLIASLQDLGVQVKIDAEARGGCGRNFRADVVAVLAGEYDLGWALNAEGNLDLVGDLQGVARYHNPTEFIDAVNQKYALKKALHQIQTSGYTVLAQQVGVHGTHRLSVGR